MKLYLKYLLAVSITGLLFSCTSSKPNFENVPEKELFTKADQELQKGNLRSSIAILEEMDKSYPFGPYSQQVQLNLIYAYYKSNDYPLAIASIDRFIKLNPTNSNIDWVLYLRGLSNMAQDDNQIQGWFNVNRSDRDYAYATAAFKDFNYLITSYPNSPYSYDAEKRLVFLKNRLANYQLKIAQYYTERGAYVAVVNRVARMLENYPDTNATRHGLDLMKNAYLQLGLFEEASKAEQLLQANISETPLVNEDKDFLWIF